MFLAPRHGFQALIRVILRRRIAGRRREHKADSGFFTGVVDDESVLDSRKFQSYESGKAVKKFSLALAGCLTIFLLTVPANNLAAPAARPTVVLISGEFEYKSAETLPVFKQYLETHYGFNCIYLERAKGEDIPGLDALAKADLVILFVRRMTLPAEDLGKIRKYLDLGKPLIGLRTASHSFENWKEFDHDVLGGNYHNHHSDKLVATTRIVPENAEHPILKGVEREFVAGGSLYLNSPLPPSSTVLLMGSVTNQPPEPVAWTHDYKGARVFYTSLGHPKDFDDPAFRRLLVNAIFWTLNRSLPETTEKKSN